MRKKLIIITVFMVSVLVAGVAITWPVLHNSDKLWQIISTQCLPGEREQGNPAPCKQVNFAQGYVIFKDRNGPLQYLLLPVERINGVESPQLLEPETPNFLAIAWRERQLLSQKYQNLVPDSAISLAINSRYGRTQDQLHIHMSCLKPSVRQKLNTLPLTSTEWQTVQLENNHYLLRILTEEQLNQQSAFLRMAKEIPDAGSEMARYGIALAKMQDGRLALMASKASIITLNRGSSEELQDHECTILQE